VRRFPGRTLFVSDHSSHDLIRSSVALGSQHALAHFEHARAKRAGEARRLRKSSSRQETRDYSATSSQSDSVAPLGRVTDTLLNALDLQLGQFTRT
jgi:hypothetical protein